ncbi:MAG: ROK family transcriptional regulator [Candidatus Krumholzibacteriia bacterium]
MPSVDWTRKGERRLDPDRPRPLADSVLRLIWQQRRISRAEIARQAGLSRSTVSEIVAEILPTGLVAESGIGKSRGGRRPVVLEFQDDAYVVLGVEMGANHVCVALTDLRGRVLNWVCRPHPVRDDPRGARALITELCSQTMDPTVTDGIPLAGIGVAVPSPVDPARPLRMDEVVLPAWGGKLGLNALASSYGVPLMVDNDANLGALAERWWGAGREVANFAYIKVATGIGAGYVVDGEVYRGATGVAGEIGHLAIDPQGKTCVCGLRGCLATVVGAQALLARTEALVAQDPGHAAHGRRLTMDDLEQAALRGDPLVLTVVREAAASLGIAVAGLLNILNPSLVIIGGDLSRLGPLLVDPLRDMVQRRTLVSSVAAAEIRTSDLGPQAVAVGAATMILKAALADSSRFPRFTGGTHKLSRSMGA